MQDLSPVTPLPWGVMSPAWRRKAAHFEPVPEEDDPVEQVRRPLYGPAEVDWDLVDFDAIPNDTIISRALGLPRETVTRARRARGAKVRKRGGAPRKVPPDMQAALEELVERMTEHFDRFERQVEDQIQAALARPEGAPMPWADLPVCILTSQELADRLGVSVRAVLAAGVSLRRRLSAYGNAGHPGRPVPWWPEVSAEGTRAVEAERAGAPRRARGRGEARAGG